MRRGCVRASSPPRGKQAQEEELKLFNRMHAILDWFGVHRNPAQRAEILAKHTLTDLVLTARLCRRRMQEKKIAQPAGYFLRLLEAGAWREYEESLRDEGPIERGDAPAAQEAPDGTGQLIAFESWLKDRPASERDAWRSEAEADLRGQPMREDHRKRAVEARARLKAYESFQRLGPVPGTTASRTLSPGRDGQALWPLDF